jgi:hypothetical protein
LPSKSRLSNNNTPILPSYPVLPSSNSRPSSSASIHRSAPVVESIKSNEPIMSNPRVRRRLQGRRTDPLPMSNQEKDLQFLTKLSQNDTLQRFRHNQRLNNHLKQFQQPSSSDEHDALPIRPSSDMISQPVIVNKYLVQKQNFYFYLFYQIVEPTRKQIRPSSVESNGNSSRPPLHSQMTKSYDSNQVHIN